ncbi:MAG: hypothetical protein AAGK17_13720 [Pseudomonadota bacterium]
MKTSNYDAARNVLGLAEFLMWGGVAVGALIALTGATAATNSFGGVTAIAGAIPGLSLALASFIGVVLIQMAKANVDTADYTYQMLDVSRQNLEVSKQVQKSGAKAPATFAELAEKEGAKAPPITAQPKASYADTAKPANEPTLSANPNKVMDYRGSEITKSAHGYHVDGQTFENIALAQSFITDRINKVAQRT